MAYDKVVDSAFLEAGLKKVGDSIRAKAGTSELLEFPDAMSAAVDAIDTSKPEQTKTATPSLSQQTIVPDSGYTLSSVTVNAMPTATQATPSISVSSDGLITASAQQSAGYVAAGTKSATKQLTTQAAKTITPSTSSQTAVSSGRYTTGAVNVAAVPTQTKTATPSAASQDVTPDSGKFLSKVTVNGDSNLVAGNIKSGVSIFGVAGSFEGSGGGTGGVETCTVSIMCDGPMQSTDIFYTNANSVFTIGTITAMEWMMGKSFTIAKGSIFLVAESATVYYFTGDVTKIGIGSKFFPDNLDNTGYSTVVAFVANSDGSIMYGM